ncbi:MAG TPA: PLP-dependent lyase/thiolase [Candidatus Bathyarchaeia archaeon]|nr:PLP-dependent lyase/thiolase [Candidatus Bathyarchaeia archaeon]
MNRAVGLVQFAGKTPLRILNNCSEKFRCRVFGKLETFNLTGSHKDRESEEIVKYAIHKDKRGLAIASTGNAAISLAAYSYIYGLECHVFVPKSIAVERIAQIQSYNPIITTSESYDSAIAECEATAERYGFLNCNPGARAEKVQGDSSIGVEIAKKQKWSYVVCPTNNGTLLAGVWKGLRSSHMKTRMVASVAKQTKVAQGIAGFHKFERQALEDAIKNSNGVIIEVSDQEMCEAARLLTSDGLIVEGAAAAAVAALNHLDLSPRSKVCCVITGTGLKFPESVRNLLSKPP